jgi:hypothetical protein
MQASFTKAKLSSRYANAAWQALEPALVLLDADQHATELSLDFWLRLRIHRYGFFHHRSPFLYGFISACGYAAFLATSTSATIDRA